MMTHDDHDHPWSSMKIQIEEIKLFLLVFRANKKILIDSQEMSETLDSMEGNLSRGPASWTKDAQKLHVQINS